MDVAKYMQILEENLLESVAFPALLFFFLLLLPSHGRDYLDDLLSSPVALLMSSSL